MSLPNVSPWSRIRTIRTKLLVYAAAVLLIPMLVYGTLAYTTARASLEPRLHAQLTDDTALIKIAVQDLLAGQLQNVLTWARLDVMRALPAGDPAGQVSGFLQSVARDYGVFLDVLIIDVHGICRASSWTEQIGRAYPELRDRFFTVDGDPLPAVSYSEQHDAFYVGLAAHIPDPHAPRRRIGTLVAMLDRAVLDGVVKPLADDGRTGVDLLLIDTDRQIIAGPARAIVSDHLPVWAVRESDSDDAVERTGRGRVYVAVSETGEKLIVSESAFEAHRALPALDWSVIASLPYRVAFAPVREVRNRILIIGSFVSLIGLLLAGPLASNLSRPIKRLTEVTRRIAREGLVEDLPAPTTADEVGELSRSFETMVKNVAAAQNDLIQSSKLAFLGELAAGIAHDIRTPLGIIKNSAQLIERRAVAARDDESHEFARFIEDEADRLNASVNVLLDIARPAALQKAPCDLGQIVYRAAQFLASEALARKVELFASPGRELPDVECDGDQIYQAVLNLVVNALQACQSGGRVEVSTVAAADGVEIVVSDTGHGISDDVRDNLFLPFVSEKAGGVGLGLAVVKRIISGHAGRLDARDRESGGAEFRIWLPRVAAVEPAEPAGENR